jgi:rSAM/selenodomain-associated transferase 1
MGCSTSVVIPALNEEPVIGQVVTRLRECPALQLAGITDIVVVDNGSDDGTAAVARAAGARVVSEPRRGYGRACLAGVLAATDAEVIVLMDGDGSDVPEDILRVWEPVRAGVADLAMGSRTRGRCEPGALTPQQRVGNAVGALLLRLLYGVRVSDLGPLRAIRRETLLRLEMQEMSYGWPTEMLAKAGRLGLKIQELPVDYRRRAGGSSKVAGTLKGTMKASWRILRTIARYRRWQPGDCAGAAMGRQDAHPSGWHGGATGPALARTGEYRTIVYAPGKAAEQQEVLASRPRQALFIVARLPLVGQTKTRLGQAIGHEAATRLYRAFLDDLGKRFAQAARRDGYDLFWFYAAPDEASEAAFAACVPTGGGLIPQESGDFGARLWQGFEALGRRGYERIVVLGSDSPHVPAAWVAQAFAALETDDVVIGPARDGGYYLLGQRGAPVDLFRGITMSTPTVYAETLARAEAAGLSVALAPATFDIDEADDLSRLHVALRSAPSSEADCAPATQAALSALPMYQTDPARSGLHHAQSSLAGSPEEAGARS